MMNIINSIKKNLTMQKMRFLLVIPTVLIIGFIAAMYVNKENEEKIQLIKLQAEKQSIMDDAAARAKQAEIDAKAKQQELAETIVNKIKDQGEIVVMKYEFSHETSYEKSGSLKFWSKNILKLKINYNAEYKINIANLNIYESNGEVYLNYNPSDFELLVAMKNVVKQSVNEDEKGWFPIEFKDEETIALINSDLEYINNELDIESAEYTNTDEVCEQFEKIIKNLFSDFGIEINVINNQKGKPYVKMEEEVIK